MPYYAQIDSNGLVYAVTETSEEIASSDMIPVIGLDVTLLGQLYVGNGVFTMPSPEIQN